MNGLTVADLIDFQYLARFEPVTFARNVLQLKTLPGEIAPGEPGFNPMLSWELDPWTEELLEAAADIDRKRHGMPTRVNHEGKTSISIRACRGVGKTFGVALVAHIWGFAYDPIVIPVTAPKLSHIKTRFMGEFVKIKGRALPGYAALMDVGSLKVEWKGVDAVNHFLIGETAKHPENIQGLRRSVTLNLMDEASGMAEPIFPVIHGNMAATDLSLFVLIGNPTKNSGSFADSHLKTKTAKDYYRMHVGPTGSLRFQNSWLEKMIRLYGINSPVVQVHGYGEFAADDQNQIIALAWVAAAMNREAESDGSLPRLRVSVDAADGGDDETVITVARHHASRVIILKQKAYSFGLARAQIDAADEAERLFQEYDGDKDKDDFVVDANGVGSGCAGELYDRGYRVIRYMGGAASDRPERWRNRRVQSYMVLRNALRDGTIAFHENACDDADDFEEIKAQLCSIKRPPNAERVEDLMTKDAMKRLGIKSPDRADSIAMQYATQEPLIGKTAGQGQEVAVIRSSVTDGLDTCAPMTDARKSIDGWQSRTPRHAVPCTKARSNHDVRDDRPILAHGRTWSALQPRPACRASRPVDLPQDVARRAGQGGVRVQVLGDPCPRLRVRIRQSLQPVGRRQETPHSVIHARH